VLPAIPTSIKAYQENKQVNPKHEVVTICAPLDPRYRPKRPAEIDPRRGAKTRSKYIFFIKNLF
jgi:hypothetical protein